MSDNNNKLSDLQQLIGDVHNHHLNYCTREIYLHGHYCDEGEPGVEYRMATTFIKNLHILDAEGKKNILVHLHSIGGEWGDGMAMYNAICQSPSPVTLLGYAQASSMSGILLQAGDKRILMPDCDFMVHYGSITASGNALEAKSAIEWNDRVCKRMLQIFAERAILGKFFQDKEYSLSKVKSYLDRKLKDKSDWYLSAEAAVYYGFADGIIGDKGCENYDKIRCGRKFKPSND